MKRGKNVDSVVGIALLWLLEAGIRTSVPQTRRLLLKVRQLSELQNGAAEDDLDKTVSQEKPALLTSRLQHEAGFCFHSLSGIK